MAPSPFAPASADARSLQERAREAATRAYVPYSGFPVGAAIRFTDGSVVTGCNVENASFGLTVCAERTALVRAVSEGRNLGEADLVVVHVDASEGQPCGMCRQVMAELVPDARVAFVAAGVLVEGRVAELLPAAFLPGALGR